MRKHLLAVASVAVLMLGTACGGDDGAKAGSDDGFSADEKKAAKALRDDLNKGDAKPSKAQEEAADCTANHIIDGVGTDKLIAAGLMTEDFEIQKASESKLPTDVAEGIASAIVACQNIEAEAEANREMFPEATDEDFDTYVACMKAIDEKTLEAALVDTMTGAQDSKSFQEYSAAAQKCSTPLGAPTNQ